MPHRHGLRILFDPEGHPLRRLVDKLPVHRLIAPMACLGSACALAWAHDVFREFDGLYQYHAGVEMLSGNGYSGLASRFWPPLYPALVGAGSRLADGFVVAKLISAFSAAAIVYLVYGIAMRLTSDPKVAALSQVFLILNPLFVAQSFQAENHLLDALLFLGVVTSLLRPARESAGGLRHLFAVGALAGLAGLTRYTSYALVPGVLTFLVFSRPGRRAAGGAAAFCAGFALLSLPWWMYNAIVSGLPLSNWQYLNVGCDLIGEHCDQWFFETQAEFGGLGDVVRADPAGYVRNVAVNLGRTGRLLLSTTGPLAPFTLLALAMSRTLIGHEHRRLLGIALAAHGLWVSQALVPVYAVLVWVPVSVVMGTTALRWVAREMGRLASPTRRLRMEQAMVLCVLVAAFGMTHRQVRSTLALDTAQHAADARVVAAALVELDPRIAEKLVMSPSPIRPYYAAARWLMIPRYYAGELEGLVTYDGVSDRVRRWAPRAPSSLDISDPRPDYLIIDRYTAECCLPQFAFLLEAESARTPAWLDLIFRTGDVSAYRIEWPLRD